ncbi:MAG: hypothetical protein JRG75_06035 [Deltaproteobacteria bacterium]|nr:hypothetical protein [Deltaproteobacteria bacterium]
MKEEITKLNKNTVIFSREKRLNKLRRDSLELQNALSNLGKELTQLMAVSELLIKEAQEKTLIH